MALFFLEKTTMKYESQYYGVVFLGDSISHHGIKGQKWGVRRFQNEDGSYTAAGKRRRGIGSDKRAKLNDKYSRLWNDYINRTNAEAFSIKQKYKDARSEYRKASKELGDRSNKEAKELVKQHRNEKNEINKEAKERRKARREEIATFQKELKQRKKARRDAARKETREFYRRTRKQRLAQYGLIAGIVVANALAKKAIQKQSMASLRKSLKNRDPFEGYRIERKSRNSLNMKNMTMDDLRKLDLY